MSAKRAIARRALRAVFIGHKSFDAGTFLLLAIPVVKEGSQRFLPMTLGIVFPNLACDERWVKAAATRIMLIVLSLETIIRASS